MRSLIILFAVGLVALLLACTGQATPAAAPTTDPSSVQEPSPEAGGSTPTAEMAAEPEQETPAASEAGDEDEIVFGGVFHATGWMASFDQLPRAGVALAVKQINESGGLLGRPVRLIELDGKTDPAVVGTAAVQLIEQGADVIIAPCDFDLGAPASLEAQKAGLVGISTCASSPLYGSVALGDKQFTTSMWNNTMGAAGAEYAYKDKGWRTAYVVAEISNDYGKTLAESFAEQFRTLGGEVVGEDTYTYGDQEFSAQINRIEALSEPPDVIYISSYMPDIGTIVRQVRGAGIEAPIMGGDGYETAEFYEAIGADAGNEIYIVTHSWLGPEAGEGMAEFIDLYEAEYGQPPDVSYIVMGWDTVQVLKQSIETAGTTEGDELARTLEDLEFDLLSGHLDWTPAEEGHFPQKAAAILQVQGGAPGFVKWVLPESVPEP